MLLGLGLPLIFLPIMGASYEGLPPGKTDQASALMNAARNTGGSIGVSIASNVLAHREQFHQSMLTGDAIPSGIAYQDTLHQVTQYFVAQGSSLVQAQQQAYRLDRPADPDASGAPRLCGRVLDADGDLALQPCRLPFSCGRSSSVKPRQWRTSAAHAKSEPVATRS